MLQVKNLTYGYRKSAKKIFNDFSLALEPGRVYGLLGRNGAGKSTLIYLMTGLLTPESGDVEYEGVDVRERRPSTLSNMFIVPEEFELPAISLKKYVEINAPFYPNFSYDDLRSYLGVFEMNDENVNLKSLSMGQKKKVFMSFAFATNTRLLLMDEPTNGLDIPSKSQFRKIIARCMNDDRTIVLSTHQVRDVDSILDHVLIIDNSRTLLNASIGEIGSRLTFEVSNNVDGALYWQPTINGNIVVRPNDGSKETMVDIEILFNAALMAYERMERVFASK
ncbi:MAG: ATP-binding cassette domain-containing protein [Muribaculaceae bacterium]